MASLASSTPSTTIDSTAAAIADLSQKMERLMQMMEERLAAMGRPSGSAASSIRPSAPSTPPAPSTPTAAPPPSSPAATTTPPVLSSPSTASPKCSTPAMAMISPPTRTFFGLPTPPFLTARKKIAKKAPMKRRASTAISVAAGKGELRRAFVSGRGRTPVCGWRHGTRRARLQGWRPRLRGPRHSVRGAALALTGARRDGGRTLRRMHRRPRRRRRRCVPRLHAPPQEECIPSIFVVRDAPTLTGSSSTLLAPVSSAENTKSTHAPTKCSMNCLVVNTVSNHALDDSIGIRYIPARDSPYAHAVALSHFVVEVHVAHKVHGSMTGQISFLLCSLPPIKNNQLLLVSFNSISLASALVSNSCDQREIQIHTPWPPPMQSVMMSNRVQLRPTSSSSLGGLIVDWCLKDFLPEVLSSSVHNGLMELLCGAIDEVCCQHWAGLCGSPEQAYGFQCQETIVLLHYCDVEVMLMLTPRLSLCSISVCLMLHLDSSMVPKSAWPPPLVNTLLFQMIVSGVLICSVSKYMVGLQHYQICSKCWKEVDGFRRKGIFQLFLGNFQCPAVRLLYLIPVQRGMILFGVHLIDSNSSFKYYKCREYFLWSQLKIPWSSPVPICPSTALSLISQSFHWPFSLQQLQVMVFVFSECSDLNHIWLLLLQSRQSWSKLRFWPLYFNFTLARISWQSLSDAASTFHKRQHFCMHATQVQVALWIDMEDVKYEGNSLAISEYTSGKEEMLVATILAPWDLGCYVLHLAWKLGWELSGASLVVHRIVLLSSCRASALMILQSVGLMYILPIIQNIQIMNTQKLAQGLVTPPSLLIYQTEEHHLVYTELNNITLKLQLPTCVDQGYSYKFTEVVLHTVQHGLRASRISSRGECHGLGRLMGLKAGLPDGLQASFICTGAKGIKGRATGKQGIEQKPEQPSWLVFLLRLAQIPCCSCFSTPRSSYSHP